MTSEEQNCDLCVLYFVNFLEELGWATSCLCPTHLISRRPGTPGSGTERVKSDMENATRVRVELVSTQHYESGYYCQGRRTEVTAQTRPLVKEDAWSDENSTAPFFMIFSLQSVSHVLWKKY